MTEQQFNRKATLIVANGDKGIDLSQLRFVFQISAADIETPNTAFIRVYNVSDDTANKIRKEYTRVILQAGYDNANFGVIFDGTLKQIKRGRENATDNFLDLIAADGDIPYNFAVLNKSLSAGMSQADRLDAIAKAAGVEVTYRPASFPGGVLPRGKVLWGMFRDEMRNFATTTGTTWNIQDGKIQVVPLTSYVPGEAVVLTSRTGMIGLPRQTQLGIEVRCLLNPRIRIGTRVKIDNKSIQEAFRQVTRATESLTQEAYTAFAKLATISADGFYRVLSIDYEGDTRGNSWYCDLVCLAIDPSAPVDQSVKEYG